MSESALDAIISADIGGAATSAIVCLTDWSIYYEYELRMFWKIMDYDLAPKMRPEYSAIYWPLLEIGDFSRIKGAFYIMMAFEFSGCILFNRPDVSLCVDDGEVLASSSDEGMLTALHGSIRSDR